MIISVILISGCIKQEEAVQPLGKTSPPVSAGLYTADGKNYKLVEVGEEFSLSLNAECAACGSTEYGGVGNKLYAGIELALSSEDIEITSGSLTWNGNLTYWENDGLSEIRLKVNDKGIYTISTTINYFDPYLVEVPSNSTDWRVMIDGIKYKRVNYITTPVEISGTGGTFTVCVGSTMEEAESLCPQQGGSRGGVGTQIQTGIRD